MENMLPSVPSVPDNLLNVGLLFSFSCVGDCAPWCTLAFNLRQERLLTASKVVLRGHYPELSWLGRGTDYRIGLGIFSPDRRLDVGNCRDDCWHACCADLRSHYS